MPEIIVSATDGAGGAVMLRERVTVSDFQSDHFAAQLVQRLSWAVGDAHAAELALQVESGSPEAQADGSHGTSRVR